LIIENIDPHRKSFKDFSLDGNILTIGDIAIDLAAEEGDQETIITFGSCNEKVHRGLMPSCTYVADVIIPPRKYNVIALENDESENTEEGGGGAGTSGPKTETIPIPLDPDSVTLRLWPVVDEAEDIENQIMEEQNVFE
jgi:hypothetical protein